ncbi:MAG: cupin domain-containing protein [Prolixibacteraceae bacterium]|nr:cupin domain-containing protein [Prolixibacteraceae bacterium]
MIITKIKDTPKVDTPQKVNAQKLYDTQHAQVMHITLQAGESLRPHITPVDVFFFILEGTVDVMVGNETVSVEADSLVESPKDIVHNLSNNSGSVARILVVKIPKPVSKTKML